METAVNISLSPAVAGRFTELLDSSGLAGEQAAIRLYVTGRGCCRATYGLVLADRIEPADTVTEVNGVRVVVDQQSRQFCDGVSIDYARTPGGEGFRVSGPRLGGGCGCGRE